MVEKNNKLTIRVAGIVPMDNGFVFMHRKNVKRNKDYEEYYTFPGGHLEEGETLEECAVRETEEETLNSNHLFTKEPAGIVKYQNIDDGDVEVYYYISISDGNTNKNIPEKDKENFEWINFDDVETKLVYENLKEFWNNIKEQIRKILEND